MKIERRTHTNDVLTLTEKDLGQLRAAGGLWLPGLEVRLAKPDVVSKVYIGVSGDEIFLSQGLQWEPNVELLFDGESSLLKAIKIIEESK